MLLKNSSETIRAAFKYWQDVTPLQIKEVCSTCKSDFTIDFVQKVRFNKFLGHRDEWDN